MAFGRAGEFAGEVFPQGNKGSDYRTYSSGSYTNKDGQRVYTTDVVVEEQEFAESREYQEEIIPVLRLATDRHRAVRLVMAS